MIEKDEKINSDKILDCIGLYCPMHIFNTAIEIEKLEPMQILEVINTILLPFRTYLVGQKEQDINS